MQDDAFNLVQRSVTGHAMTDDENLLESMRITRNKELQPMQFLFRIFGKPCFPRGELVAITGKAKSGKTLFNSVLMACCVNEEVLQVQRPFDDDDGEWQCPILHCLWYDTEQSEQSTQDILKNRILRLTGGKEDEQYYDIFNVRCLRYGERLRLFKAALRRFHPALVVLDGVRDLLSDINDGIRAQEIVEELMKLAQETRCCMVCVLHQNKGAEDRNPRGWLGTELMNKAFEVYTCEKLKPENIFMVEQTHTRKYDLGELLFFRMDEESGLPVVCDAPTRLATNGANSLMHEKLPYMNREYLYFDDNNKPHPKTDELFYEALKLGPQFYSDLQTKVQQLLNCGTQMWNNMFREMRDKGAIVRSKNRDGKTVWQLPAGETTITHPDMFEKASAVSGESPSS
jgi:hypothetical protein